MKYFPWCTFYSYVEKYIYIYKKMNQEKIAKKKGLNKKYNLSNGQAKLDFHDQAMDDYFNKLF